MRKSIVNSSMPHTLLNERQQEFFDSVGYSCFNEVSEHIKWEAEQVVNRLRSRIYMEMREMNDETD